MGGIKMEEDIQKFKDKINEIEILHSEKILEIIKNKKFNFPGVYFIFLPDDSKLIYIGMTKRKKNGEKGTILTRIKHHISLNQKSDLKVMLKNNKELPQEPKEYLVKCLNIEDDRERMMFECFAIAILNPKLNK